ncbi:Zinc finger protein [Plakobranchus ocellatus]|uniref:Zinc finger protein n=1 Tax=Plakobranchus ocellatus TaxID=259542 RepID=A0AAV4B0R4_9GAST|nr:Zinc finger protein [Plakobranchus ocellatus]
MPFKRVQLIESTLLSHQVRLGTDSSLFSRIMPIGMRSNSPRKIDTKKVDEALVDIYSRLGVPEEVLSDQRTQFMSDYMSEVCSLLRIKQRMTIPYHLRCKWAGGEI